MLSDMTANQYVAAIERLGINKSQAAVLLGLDLRTQRRYLSGESRPARLAHSASCWRVTSKHQ